MGIDYNSYNGPYLKIKNPEKEYTEQRWTCPNKECSNHKKHVSYFAQATDKFCGKCGTTFGNVTVYSKKNVNFFELGDEMADQLSPAFYHHPPEEFRELMILIPNKKILDRDCNFSRREQYLVQVDELRIQQEIEIFKQRYSKEIEILKTKFNPADIETCWGTMMWAS